MRKSLATWTGCRAFAEADCHCATSKNTSGRPAMIGLPSYLCPGTASAGHASLQPLLSTGCLGQYKHTGCKAMYMRCNEGCCRRWSTRCSRAWRRAASSRSSSCLARPRTRMAPRCRAHAACLRLLAQRAVSSNEWPAARCPSCLVQLQSRAHALTAEDCISTRAVTVGEPATSAAHACFCCILPYVGLTAAGGHAAS